MSDPLSALHNKLRILRDAVGDIPLSGAEEEALAWLAGQELATVMNLAAVIHRARGVRP